MAEPEESVSSLASHRSRRRQERRHMLPERDTFAPDVLSPPTHDDVRILKPRLPRLRRGSADVPRNFITTEAETHVVRMSPSPGTPGGGHWEGGSDRQDTERGHETEVPPSGKMGAKSPHAHVDIPQLRPASSEDESLRSMETTEKQKAPKDAFLGFTLTNAPSDTGIQEEKAAGTKEQSGRGSREKSSFLRKWTKKMGESFSKSSSVERAEVDEEGLASTPRAGEDLNQSEPVLLTVDEVKKPRRKEKKKAERNVPIGGEKVGVGPVGSPPSKRDLRRREKAGEFTADEKILGVKIHHTDVLPNDPDVNHPVVQVRAMDRHGNPIPKSDAEMKGGDVLVKGREDRTMTRPFRITGSRLFGYVPKWEEMVYLETPFERLVSAEAESILFFEILDFLPMCHRRLEKKVKGELGWHRVAWSFLKPLSADGSTYVNRRIRLQLYKPEGRHVYECWKRRKWKKLNSTLYVTLKGVLPPERQSAEEQSLASLLSLQKAQLTEALIEGQLPPHKPSLHSQVEVDEVQSLGRPGGWSRLAGKSCKVPNRLKMCLPVSELDSLDMRVTGSVHCLQFSPCGHFLAGGFDATPYHGTLIFEIPSGKLVRSLRGHHGLIYEVAWAETAEDSTFYLLATASADSTVRLWTFQRRVNEAELLAVLPHPSFVYSVAFSPLPPLRLATGCFDAVIRIWEVPTEAQPTHVSAPSFLVDGHRSHINALRFHPSGEILFSGDGGGNLCQWSFSSSNHPPTLHKEMRLGSCISCLSVDTTGRKLLVQLKESLLQILDVETFLVLHFFRGHENRRLRLQSVFSPCGNFVLCGGEDACLCIWESTTGRLLSYIRPPNHTQAAVSAVSFHPWDNYVAIGLSSGANEPQPILIYTHGGLSVGDVRLRKAFERSHLEGEDGLQRGDSSEKFRAILQKLEELTPSMATVTARLMQQKKALKK